MMPPALLSGGGCGSNLVSKTKQSEQLGEGQNILSIPFPLIPAHTSSSSERGRV